MPHYLVIGATGPSGLAFAYAALASGHALTLYVRNPSKVDPALGNNEKVNVVEGELADKAKVCATLKEGAVDAVITFAGPSVQAAMRRFVGRGGEKGTPITDGYRQGLFPAMKEAGIKRLLVLCTPSYPDASDHSSAKWSSIITFIRLLANPAYTEIRAIGALTAAQPADELEWTLFRVPFLTNGEAGPVFAGYVGDAGDGLFLSRAALAGWCLGELEEGRWVGKAPKLSNA